MACKFPQPVLPIRTDSSGTRQVIALCILYSCGLRPSFIHCACHSYIVPIVKELQRPGHTAIQMNTQYASRNPQHEPLILITVFLQPLIPPVSFLNEMYVATCSIFITYEIPAFLLHTKYIVGGHFAKRPPLFVSVTLPHPSH